MSKEIITCRIRKIDLIKTKEEAVRQNYIKILIEDYGYPEELIKVEYGVKRSPSDTRRSLPVDIAVFENNEPKIFVETKSPEVKEGLEQLKNYMDFESNVRYGVWTNGNQEEDQIGIQYIEKEVKDNSIKYKERFNIPRKGYSTVVEEIKKKDCTGQAQVDTFN